MANKTVKGKHYTTQVAANLRAVIDHQADGKILTWAEKYGLNQTSINRICNGTVSPTAGYLQEIAEKCGYAAWQLLHPEFDVRKTPPTLDGRAMRVAAIFSAIESQIDRDRAESIMEQFAPAEPGQPATRPSALQTRSL
jgi:transcriptional regulator with XRE-family HTH domain